MNKLRAIFHVDEMSKWQLTIGNLRNLVRARENLDLIVLANSEAVKYLLADGADGEIKILMENKIKVRACENALRAFEIEVDDLVTGVETVEAGVLELVERQEEGYAYIKP